MAVTRSGNKRPASSAETGAPDSPPGKRRKVMRVKKAARPTGRGAISAASGQSAASSTSSSKKQPSTRPARKSTTRRVQLPSSHGMRTRAQARIFRFRDLPAEVRNLVYAEAYRSDTPVRLDELRMPEQIKIPVILSEALPFWLENTPIIIPVIGNWCVRHQHLHRPGQGNYNESGTVKEFPRILVDSRISSAQIRFKQLHYRVRCACCVVGKEILNVDIEMIHNGNGKAALVETEVVNRQSVYAKVVDGLDKMSGAVKEAAEHLTRREDFNGFTVDDIKTLARCFRDDDYDDKFLDHSLGN